jgi:hypothetical protein
MSIFLQEEPIATLFFDIHRLLKHQFACRNLSDEAASILLDINNIYSDTCFMDLCRGSLPEEFLWAYLSRIRAKRILDRMVCILCTIPMVVL